MEDEISRLCAELPRHAFVSVDTAAPGTEGGTCEVTSSTELKAKVKSVAGGPSVEISKTYIHAYRDAPTYGVTGKQLSSVYSSALG